MFAHPNLLGRRKFDTAKLAAEFPPRFAHPYKTLVHRIACPQGCVHCGAITVSRWSRFPLPEKMPAASTRTALEIKESVFDYVTPASEDVVQWYLNFAHHNLFVAHGGPLFAQDEMQVAEHPALGSVREALLASDIKPLTVEQGQPTPILIQGVERRCRVATNADPEQLRPSGLYGNHFARASARAIELATTPLSPPTLTNLIAMEAPYGGDGMYTEEQILYILTTALTGFAAAKIESHARDQRAGTTIHTGFWGCGAYGGDRVLMILLQVLAANLAGVERLVFHTVNPAGSVDMEDAQEILENDLFSRTDVRAVVNTIVGMKFWWGVSDGN